MFQPLALLFPALVPSWRFFDEIAPSPRIEFRTKEEGEWQEFRPRPAHVSLSEMLKRMVWNPWWNETLFLMSCAERLMQNQTEHSSREIVTRIRADLGNAPYLQFRLVYVSRQGAALVKHVTYLSPGYAHEP